MTLNTLDERVLIMAPLGQDGPAMAERLTAGGFATQICTSTEACRLETERGAAVLLLTEESLELSGIDRLMAHLHGQPPWSELPLILLTGGGESRLANLLDATALAGSVTLLERPIGPATLLRSVDVALRSRQRQYQVRDLIDKQQHQQQQIRESEEKYRMLFKSMDEGFCIIEMIFDDEGRAVDYRFLEVNPAFTKQSGMENVIGRQMRELVPDHEPYWMDVYGRVALTGEPVRFQSEARGLNRIFDVYAFPIDDAGQRRVAVLFNDMTRRKQAEEDIKTTNLKLQQLNAHLETRVAERTAKLEEQAVQLRLLAKELTETEQRERKKLAEILHDHVQQLLVASKMRLNMLGSRFPGFAPELQGSISFIDEAIASSRSLSAELRPPVLYEGGLSPAFVFLARKMKEQYGFDVHLEIGDDVHPMDDGVKIFLFQAVSEILLNMVKHADVKECALSAGLLPNGDLHVTVSDRGRGFDPAILDDPKKRGWGLFTIRERLRGIGGDFKVRSSPGAGATFQIRVKQSSFLVPEKFFPAEPPSEPRSGISNQRGGSSLVARVLLVDDHRIVREGIRFLLEEQDFIEVVGEAENGEKAIALAMALRPDVVVMDINMPGMNGIETTRILRDKLPDVKVIGLSVQNERETAASILQAGAEAFFNKDGDTAELIGAIRHYAGLGPVPAAPDISL